MYTFVYVRMSRSHFTVRFPVVEKKPKSMMDIVPEQTGYYVYCTYTHIYGILLFLN